MCSSDLNKALAKRPSKYFVGKLAKVRFQAAPSAVVKDEWMWVAVRGSLRGYCRGILLNKPLYCDLRLGQTVSFTPSDVAETREGHGSLLTVAAQVVPFVKT